MQTPHLLVLATAILVAFGGQAHAGRVTDIDAVPHIDAKGKQAYRQFLATAVPRAFAIAPGGAWGWSTEAATANMAEREALANCQANTRQRCQLYARDNAVVLRSADWVRSWGPYQKSSEAAKTETGTLLGKRFPDLVINDEKGRPIKVSSWRGKAVVLHFWGSWCPPCQREMPELAKLYKSLRQTRDIRFAFLQVREDFASARACADKITQGLPLYDSGAGGFDAEFKLADGSRISDRTIAMAFPTTYVLDKHGIVVFSHTGPVTAWAQYAPFLRDVAVNSGK
ncbi:MAG: redoxin family protein [Gallionellaceae bacterium]|nr:redoxin family protein [Gallionellaceae bacterium]MDD5364059.1 redoxin family protein [Gallionellaceae bacterium]